MTGRSREAGGRGPRSLVVGVLAAVVVLSWLFGTPPGGGLDEADHFVRSAALVRGDASGDEFAGGANAGVREFDLPDGVPVDDGACFRGRPFQPAACAVDTLAPAKYFSRVADEPVWAHAVAGSGTFVDGDAAWYLTRALAAAVPASLVLGALLITIRRGPLAVAAITMTLTATVWSSIATISTTGWSVAGAVALWVGLLAGGAPRRSESALAVAGWATLVLARHDGLFWAVLVVATLTLLDGTSLRARWRRLSTAERAVLGVATVIATVQAATNPSTAAATSIAALGVLAAVAAAPDGVVRAARRSPVRLVGLAAAAVGTAIVVAGARGSFVDGRLTVVLGRTGATLRESFGLLGALDTPVPRTAVIVWLTALGVLATGALFARRSRLAAVGAAGVLVVAVGSSWWLALVRDDPSALSARGVDMLPLLVGVPLLLGHTPAAPDLARRIARPVVVAACAVWVVAFAAALRRWGVGTAGSMLPWRWDTYGAPFAPSTLVAVHTVAVIGLGASLVRYGGHGRARWLDPVVADVRGVNLVGYHSSASGLGTIARRLHASFDAAGLPVTVVDVDDTPSPRHDGAAVVEPQRWFDTTVSVVTADELPAVLDRRPDLDAATALHVGYWFWELHDVPARHQLALARVDAVWAPTRFVADAYRPVSEVPVHVVPSRLDAPTVDDEAVARWRMRVAPHGEFVFLTSFDMLSIVERKNPFAVIAAFRNAFQDDPAVRLVIKTMNGHLLPDDLARVVDATAGDERIELIDEFVPDADVVALIAAADCFVSLHRSEGLGLHLADAMWVGTPVIATGYSGNVDFMTDDEAALVPAELVGVRNGHESYPPTARWAEPDVAVAADRMRRLVDDVDERARQADAALARMRRQPEAAEFGARAIRRLRVGHAVR